MPKSLLPPRGVEMPTALLYDRKVSPAVRDTWLQIRGLAWGATETPEVTMQTLIEITGKSQSTIFEHMRLLGSWGVIRWHNPRKATFIFEFDDNDKLNSGYSEKSECKTDSRNSESSPLKAPSINSDSIKGVVKEIPNFRKVGMDNRRKPDTVPLDTLKPIIDILAAVTQMDKSLNYSRLAKEAKALHLAGYTHEQVKAVYGEGGKWYLCDWRGLKGETPDLGVVRSTIKALLVATPVKQGKNGNGRNGSKPAETADDIIQRRREKLKANGNGN